MTKKKSKPAARKLRARVIQKKEAYTDMRGMLRVNEYLMEFDRHDGGTHQVTRYMLERDRAVAVLAYDPARDEVLLVNEFRAGLLLAGEDPFNNALPGGGIDAGETVLQAARREMFEETGLRVRNLQIIHPGAFVSSGGSTETLALVFGVADLSKVDGLTVFNGHADSAENIRPVVLTSDDYIRQAMSGKLKNMGTCLAALWLLQHRAGLKKKIGPSPSARKAPKKNGPKSSKR